MDDCIHGMNPEWCAICLKQKLPEEEPDPLTFKGLLKGL